MADSKGYQGRGSLIEMSTDNVNWTHVLQVRKFDPGEMKIDREDISNLDSPIVAGGAIAYKEYIPAFADAGEVSGDGVLNPQDPSFQTLNDAFNDGTILYWRISLVDGTVDTFRGYVSGLKPLGIEYNKSLSFSFKIQITGTYLRTPASGATPTITSLVPTTAAVGDPVEIVGTGFYNARGTGGVTVNAVAATILAWSDTSIVIRVPNTTTGNVVVTNAGAHSSGGTHTLTIA